jgi:hypothetical protein
MKLSPDLNKGTSCGWLFVIFLFERSFGAQCFVCLPYQFCALYGLLVVALYPVFDAQRCCTAETR